jgi:ABC-type uncharacterized transport system substrate-binding protein
VPAVPRPRWSRRRPRQPSRSFEDRVKLGLVTSYNRPGGNVTGVALLIDVLGAKRLGLLREIVPAATLIAVLLNPTWATLDAQLKDVQEAARAVGQQIQVLRANTSSERIRCAPAQFGTSTSGCRWPDRQ